MVTIHSRSGCWAFKLQPQRSFYVDASRLHTHKRVARQTHWQQDRCLLAACNQSSCLPIVVSMIEIETDILVPLGWAG